MLTQAAAILWYPGSFAPFHVGHLNCLRAAKKELSQQLHLAGAYVQPQPFGHLAYKLLVSTGGGSANRHVMSCEKVLLWVGQQVWKRGRT